MRIGDGAFHAVGAIENPAITRTERQREVKVRYVPRFLPRPLTQEDVRLTTLRGSLTFFKFDCRYQG